MINLPQEISVFSLSEKDIFQPKNLEFAKQWLMSKHDEPYYFREKRPKSLPSGSITVFSFEAQIFGQAKTKEEIKEVLFERQENMRKGGRFVYKYSVLLDDSSTEVFRHNPLKKDLTEKLGIRWSRLFTSLSPDEYREILKMARA